MALILLQDFMALSPIFSIQWVHVTQIKRPINPKNGIFLKMTLIGTNKVLRPFDFWLVA